MIQAYHCELSIGELKLVLLSCKSQICNILIIDEFRDSQSRTALKFSSNEPEEGNRSTEDAAKSGSCSVSVPSTTAESKTVATK